MNVFFTEKEISTQVFVGLSVENTSQFQKMLSSNKFLLTVKNFGNKKYLRFHVLGHSYPDLKFFAKRGTEIDSSIILINQPYITPNYHPDIDLVKAPYVWEDGMILNFKFIQSQLN